MADTIWRVKRHNQQIWYHLVEQAQRYLISVNPSLPGGTSIPVSPPLHPIVPRWGYELACTSIVPYIGVCNERTYTPTAIVTNQCNLQVFGRIRYILWDGIYPLGRIYAINSDPKRIRLRHITTAYR